jgi:hypothetical protein
MPDYDSPWKEAMDRYFAWFLLFFFPKIHALLDWLHDPESLDSELRKLAPESVTGKRLIDKLIKARKAGTDDMRLLHVEVQGRKEEGFARRMHVYNYRIEDVHSHPVLTLVILGDEDPQWRPVEYVFEEEGCRRTLRWPMVKLLDFANRLDSAANDPNLFGSLVAAHLVAQRTAEDGKTRKDWKLRLLRGLYSRNLEGEDVRQWSRYIDWLLPLPRSDEEDVVRQIQQLEKEESMPFVSIFERLAEERAEKLANEAEKLANERAEQRVKQATEQAEQAAKLVVEQAQKEARLAVEQATEQAQKEAEQAVKLAVERAQQDQHRAGLHRSIEALLDVRFRAEGLALMPDVRQKTDVALLERLVEALRADATLEDVRKLLA